jgi:hypothetical protein
LVTIGLDTTGLTEGAKRASVGLDKTKEKATGVAKEMQAQGKKAGEFFGQIRNQLLGLFTAFTAGKGVSDFIKTITSADSAIGRMAKSINSNTGEISLWQHAMKAFSGDANGAVDSYAKLVSDFEKFKLTGQAPPAIAYLRALGVDIVDAGGKMKSMTQLYTELADVMEKRKMSAPQKLEFLRGVGVDDNTARLIMQGKAALQKQLAEAAKSGVVTPEDAAAAQARQEAFSNLGDTLDTLGRTISTSLTPALIFLLKKLRELAIWFQSHPTALKIAVGVLTAAIGALSLALLGLSFAPLIAGLNAVIGLTAGISTLAAAIMGLVAATTALGAVAAIGVARKAAREWAVGKAPRTTDPTDPANVSGYSPLAIDRWRNEQMTKGRKLPPLPLQEGVAWDAKPGEKVTPSDAYDRNKKIIDDFASKLWNGIFNAKPSSEPPAESEKLSSAGDDIPTKVFSNKPTGDGARPSAHIIELAGARAAGGPVQAGKSYLVGEKGPEVVNFGSSGNVIPNHDLAKSNVVRLSTTLAASAELFNSAAMMLSGALKDQAANENRTRFSLEELGHSILRSLVPGMSALTTVMGRVATIFGGDEDRAGHPQGHGEGRGGNAERGEERGGNEDGAPRPGEGRDGPVQLSDKESARRNREDVEKFEGMGWTREQAAGIVANLRAESGSYGKNDFKAVGDGGEAYGLAQWHKDRQANFRKVFGHGIRESTRDEQLKFVDWELRNTERDAGRSLARAKDEGTSGAVVSREFERPGTTEAIKAEAARNRAALARGIYESLKVPDDVFSRLAQKAPPSVLNLTQGAPANAAETYNNDNSRSNSTVTHTSTTHIGTINTQATDGEGLARDLDARLDRFRTANAANYGIV